MRYSFRCGYCGVSEEDVGGELTVDHFRPVAAGGDDTEENLVYACVRCNQYKGALRPEAMDRGSERRLLHPRRDDLSLHLIEDPLTGRLEGLSPAGQFHIEALRLNRPALIANRQRGHFLEILQIQLEQVLRENAELRERLSRQDIYIAHLEEQVETPERRNDTG